MPWINKSPNDIVMKEINVPTAPKRVIVMKLRKNCFFLTWNLKVKSTSLLKSECKIKCNEDKIINRFNFQAKFIRYLRNCIQNFRCRLHLKARKNDYLTNCSFCLSLRRLNTI